MMVMMMRVKMLTTTLSNDETLSRTSDDIDLALDNVSGTTFAEAVNQYMADQGLETHTIGVIQVGQACDLTED